MDTLVDGIGVGASVRGRVAAAEWAVRVELAACYRLVAHYGWTDLTFTHISARIPWTDDQFLLNPFGLYFDEVTASSLIKVDGDGHILSPEGQPIDAPRRTINEAGFVIHSAIHRARHDVACVLHTHTPAGMAVAMQEDGLLFASQHAQMFFGKIGYHDHEGFALDLSERERLAADIADKPVLILRNHGLLVAGPTIPMTFSLTWHLEKACQAQVLAMAGGAKIHLPSAAASEQTVRRTYSADSAIGTVEWPGLLRKVDRLDPSYKN